MNDVVTNTSTSPSSLQSYPLGLLRTKGGGFTMLRNNNRILFVSTLPPVLAKLPNTSIGEDGVQCHWNSIDWPRAYKMVKNLRFRIFKATKRGDVKTVRRLQRLLIRSYENRLLAVRQISHLFLTPSICSEARIWPAVSPLFAKQPEGYLPVRPKGINSFANIGSCSASHIRDLWPCINMDDVVTNTSTGVIHEYGGLDKFLVNTSKERGELVDFLGTTSISTWKPDSTHRIYIPTDVSGIKNVVFCQNMGIINRCLQYIVKNALEPEWEARFEGSTYGFRPGRSCHDALHSIYKSLTHTPVQKTWVLDANISGCFHNISHDYLQNAIKNFPEKSIIERWLKSEYVFNNVCHPIPPQGVFCQNMVRGILTEYGSDYVIHMSNGDSDVIPFGERSNNGHICECISPLLANIVLHGMQESLGITISDRGETTGEKSLVRYANNFLVFCTNEITAKKTYVELSKWLSLRGLSLSKEKTKITHIDQGFDFLGTTIRRFHISDVKTRLLIKPSKKSTLQCRSKLKRLWNQGQGKPINLTIRKLNAFIRGWANYFRPYVSKKVFSSLDDYMFTQAVRFTRRTHPLKSWQWRKKHYFGKFRLGRKNNWVFGEKKTGHFLLRFSWFPIQRYIMVNGENSPYDPDLSEYWLKRQSNRVSWEFTQKKDMKIASKQKHVCPLCKESLYTGEELHRHYKIPLKEGGPDMISNIVFLHILCHQQIHTT